MSIAKFITNIYYQNNIKANVLSISNTFAFIFI